MNAILPKLQLKLPDAVKSVRVAENQVSKNVAVVGMDETGEIIGIFSPEFKSTAKLDIWLKKQGLQIVPLSDIIASTN